MSINIEINDKEIQYTNKELIKIGFDFQSSLTQTVIEFAQKEFNLNSSQLKILTKISSNWGGTINTTINQIGSIIISNQNFSNVEKIVVSSSVATLANFAEYKYSGS